VSSFVRLDVLGFHPERRTALLILVKSESNSYGAGDGLAAGIGENAAELHYGRHDPAGCWLLRVNLEHATNQ